MGIPCASFSSKIEFGDGHAKVMREVDFGL
jgi:hypothetical protein